METIFKYKNVTKKRLLICLMVILTMIYLLYMPKLRKYQLESQTKIESKTIFPQLQARNPENIPLYYYNIKQLDQTSYNESCAPFPSLLDLTFNNNIWQSLETKNGATFQLLNAYLDNRELNVKRPSIRILAMIDRVDPLKFNTFCQIRYENSRKPLIVPSAEYFYIWYHGWGGEQNGTYQPYLISCHIPSEVANKIPVSVSLVEKFCDKPQNNLRVIYNVNQKKGNDSKFRFAVCVKGLNFPDEDKSIRLSEWLELLFLLGADKVFFYEFQIHPNIKKLLNYYQNINKVEVSSLTLAGKVSNSPLLQNLFLRGKITERRLQEVLPYNDCFYKNLYKYKYVVLLDIDEIIVPIKDTWLELLEVLENQNQEASAYVAQNVYFLDSHLHNHDWFKGIPRYMHILQHVYRARNYTKPGHYIKCFHNTNKVLTLHNHYPRTCLQKECNCYPINTNLAHLQHYRSDCADGIQCETMKSQSVMDLRVWNFKFELIERVESVLNDLNLLNESMKY